MSGKSVIIIAHLYVIYLFSNIYIVERSMDYQINEERSDCPTCLRGVFHHYRGRELKTFFVCSIYVFKASLHKNDVIDLWRIICTISHTISETTRFYPATEVLPFFILLHEVLLATSERSTQATTVCTIQ